MTREGTVDAIWSGDITDRYGIEAQRIRDAVEKARDAFWASIVESFPEVTSGDMAPGDEIAMEWGTNAAVLTWLMWNHPGARDDS